MKTECPLSLKAILSGRDRVYYRCGYCGRTHNRLCPANRVARELRCRCGQNYTITHRENTHVMDDRDR